MRTILFIFIVTVGATMSARSQSGPACPTITIIGPAGVSQPGDVIEFAGSISGNVPAGITQEWLISVGEIIAGQGTLRIKVRTSRESSNYTATLRFFGLPTGCVDSVTETATIDCVCDPIHLDEFGNLTLKAERTRLDAATSALKQRPNFKLVIILYFDPRETERLKIARTARIVDYLTRTKGIPARFLDVISGGTLKTRTKIYLVAPGLKIPSP